MNNETKDVKLTDEEYITKLENAIDDLNNYTNHLQNKLQQKDNAIDECIEFVKEKIDICDGFIDTAESDLTELKYTLFAADNMKKLLKENKFALKIYQELLETLQQAKDGCDDVE